MSPVAWTAPKPRATSSAWIDRARTDPLLNVFRPICRRPSKAHGTEETTRRHLEFLQTTAYLPARVPRYQFDEHDIKQVQVHWTRPCLGLILLFEVLVMALVQAMSMASVGKLVRERWQALVAELPPGEDSWSQGSHIRGHSE